MELAHLKAFVALADSKHFGRAADRLNITQPALTKRLKSLEMAIGLQLFDRNRRGVALTKTGEQLLASARHIVGEADALIAHSRRLVEGSTGLLEIGFGLSTIDLAPRMVAAFRRAFPSVAVTLNDLPSSEQEARLEDQRLDLGFMRLPLASPILTARTVMSDRLALALPATQRMTNGIADFESLNKVGWLLLGSGVVTCPSRHQAGDERSEQGFAASACVVHELEEAEIKRQLVLRNASMRAKPGTQQRPEPLHCVDVDLAKAVAVLVAGILAASMADRLVLVALGGQARVDAVFVCVDEGARGDGGGDDWLDRGLLHVGQHAQHDLPAALDQAEDRRLVLFQRAAARRACQLAAPSKPPLLATAAGWPLCPATT